MRICYLADANSVHTKKWCNYFKNLGYEIHVISLSDGQIEGVKVHPLNIALQNVKSEILKHKFGYLFTVNAIKKLLKQIKPDLLHAHYASSYGLLGSLVNFHPFIISVWGSDIYDFPQRGFIFKQIIRSNLKKADCILSTSKAMAEETKKYTTKEITITPFGVDINKFRPLSQPKDSKTIVIGTVKSLEEIYGIEYLIKAFSIVKKQYINVRLEIAGVGSQENYLKNLCKDLNIENDVIFLGFLNQASVIETFNRFHIGVFPSIVNESFGVAAVEAQACGIPVIVSNVGGLPEATSPGNTSILVNKKSSEEIAVGIKKLIEDEALRNTMGENARKFIVDNYNIVDNFEKVNDLYKGLIK